MIEIKLAEKNDLPQCAEILRDIYNNNVLDEGGLLKVQMLFANFTLNKIQIYSLLQKIKMKLLALPFLILNLGLMVINLWRKNFQ